MVVPDLVGRIGRSFRRAVATYPVTVYARRPYFRTSTVGPVSATHRHMVKYSTPLLHIDFELCERTDWTYTGQFRERWHAIPRTSTAPPAQYNPTASYNPHSASSRKDGRTNLPLQRKGTATYSQGIYSDFLQDMPSRANTQHASSGSPPSHSLKKSCPCRELPQTVSHFSLNARSTKQAPPARGRVWWIDQLFDELLHAALR